MFVSNWNQKAKQHLEFYWIFNEFLKFGYFSQKKMEKNEILNLKGQKSNPSPKILTQKLSEPFRNGIFWPIET